MLIRVVIAVDNPVLQEKLSRVLRRSHRMIETVEDRSRFWKKAARKDCDLVVISQPFVTKAAPTEMHYLRQLSRAPALVVFSEEDNAEEKAQFVADGFEAVLNSSRSVERIGDAINAILEKQRKVSYLTFTKERELSKSRSSDFVADSPAMKEFVKAACRLMNSDSTVLIRGETGVGKERLAQALHSGGPRREGSFIPTQCGALPESLLDSEPFGHVEGAFAGATRSGQGCFELAHGAATFLDEIGEVPSHLQAKLLGVLEGWNKHPVSFQQDERI